ncbi:hypothetical protein ACRAWD_30950 [Caulobacter segnis]
MPLHNHNLQAYPQQPTETIPRQGSAPGDREARASIRRSRVRTPRCRRTPSPSARRGPAAREQAAVPRPELLHRVIWRLPRFP